MLITMCWLRQFPLFRTIPQSQLIRVVTLYGSIWPWWEYCCGLSVAARYYTAQCNWHRSNITHIEDTRHFLAFYQRMYVLYCCLQSLPAADGISFQHACVVANQWQFVNGVVLQIWGRCSPNWSIECSLSSRLEDLGSVVSSPVGSGVITDQKPILSYFEGHRTLLFIYMLMLWVRQTVFHVRF